MAKKASVTSGFISMLGSLPMQLALLLTFIAIIKIPRDVEGNMDKAVVPIYHCIWIMHLGSGLVVLLN